MFVSLLGAMALVNPFVKARKTQEFAVDRRAILHEWIPLLDTWPRIVSWEPTNPDSTWNHDAEKKRLTVSNSTLGVFGVGETRSNSFRLQATLGRTAWTGSVGIFFGGLPVKSENGIPGTRYEVIYFETKNPNGPATYELHRDIYDFFPNKGTTHCSLQSEQLAAKPIEKPAGECTLEIRVAGGRLASVNYGGASVEELTPFPNRGIVIPADQPITFGVSNGRGATTFRDVRFMLVGSAGQSR
jgi:hypothetical protein